MRVGPYSVKLVTKRVDNRPIEKRHPWLQRWTGWKCLAILQIIAGVLMIIVTVMTIAGHESSQPAWLWGIMSLQILGAPGWFIQHRKVLAWRAEHPNYYR